MLLCSRIRLRRVLAVRCDLSPWQTCRTAELRNCSSAIFNSAIRQSVCGLLNRDGRGLTGLQRLAFRFVDAERLLVEIVAGGGEGAGAAAHADVAELAAPALPFQVIGF